MDGMTRISWIGDPGERYPSLKFFVWNSSWSGVGWEEVLHLPWGQVPEALREKAPIPLMNPFKLGDHFPRPEV